MTSADRNTTLCAIEAGCAAALGYVIEDNRVLIERVLSAGAIPQDAVVTMDNRPASGSTESNHDDALTDTVRTFPVSARAEQSSHPVPR